MAAISRAIGVDVRALTNPARLLTGALIMTSSLCSAILHFAA